jgi:diguanylate cyclase (GGDEF)-like protein
VPGYDNRYVRFRFFLGLAVVAAIAVGCVVAALVVRDHETNAFEARQKDEAVRAAGQAEASAALSLGQLASAAAFYQTVDRLTAHKFHVMAESLLSAGNLRGTALILAVRNRDRARFERGRGRPIVDITAGGFPRAARRHIYYPLAFADSHSLLKPPLGYDLGGDPLRAPYLFRARDSGRPVASRVMQLLSGGAGIYVFRPVYRDGATTATVTQRRHALRGFAVGSFDVRKLAAAASSAVEGDVDVQLRENGQSVEGPSLPPGESDFSNLRIADRTWVLALRDPAAPKVTLPALIAVFGISIAVLLAALVMVWSRKDRMQELQRQASQDVLTGLKNRRRFEEDLHRELARSRREGTEGAVLMLDLDHFKQVNDTLGHPTGDRLIAGIADVLRSRMRETDVVARLGGDEFALVLPRCDQEEALTVAEEIAAAVRDHGSDRGDVPNVTASIGIAMFGPGRQGDFDRALTEADAAMYEAKQSGRDTVRLAKPEPVAEPKDPVG